MTTSLLKENNYQEFCVTEQLAEIGDLNRLYNYIKIFIITCPYAHKFDFVWNKIDEIINDRIGYLNRRVKERQDSKKDAESILAGIYPYGAMPTHCGNCFFLDKFDIQHLSCFVGSMVYKMHVAMSVMRSWENRDITPHERCPFFGTLSDGF